jgi:phytoene/squalene synthetase
MGLAVDVEEALDWCVRFVDQRPSNVTRLAGLLPRTKRPMFYPAYCAMRVIDDEVDNDFLALPETEREAQRVRVARRVEQWRARAIEALEGRFVADTNGEDARIFTAMNATLGRSNIGTQAFHGLADAMQRDVAERPLATWQDFLHYTEGAAVAPAAVFVFILAAKLARDGSSRSELMRPCADYARHLAIFSYLVHILRDLKADAERAPQHLTLPDDLLAQAGLTKPLLQEAARQGDDTALASLVGIIAELCERHYVQTMEDLAALNDETAGAAAMLVGLAEVYRQQFDAIRHDYGAVLGGENVVDMATVDRLLAGTSG